MEAPFIDIHNHNKFHSNEVIELVSVHPGQDKHYLHYSIGCHPWWTDQPLTDEAINMIRYHYLNERNCLALGEIGLDKFKGASLSVQKINFIQQIELANELNAPVVIHCVREFDSLLKIKREIGRTPWMVHGFVRNKILAFQLLDAGFFISIAPKKNMSETLLATIKSLPLDRIFLETDGDRSIDIYQRYHIFASARDISLDLLKESIFTNFNNFIDKEWVCHNG